MENNDSQNRIDPDDTLVFNEKRIFSSTLVEEPADQSLIEIKKNIPLVDLDEEITRSFVAESTGVIHIKTETISKAAVSSSPKDKGMDNVKGKASLGATGNGDLKLGSIKRCARSVRHYLTIIYCRYQERR